MTKTRDRDGCDVDRESRSVSNQSFVFFFDRSIDRSLYEAVTRMLLCTGRNSSGVWSWLRCQEGEREKGRGQETAIKHLFIVIFVLSIFFTCVSLFLFTIILYRGDGM